jgi:hypothetical protein
VCVDYTSLNKHCPKDPFPLPRIDQIIDWTEGCVMSSKWPARWEPQEEGVMNIAARFPAVKKPRYVDQERSKQTTEGDAC